MDILPILRSVIEYTEKKGRRRKDNLRARARSLSLVEQVARGHRAVRISLLKYNHRAPIHFYRSPRFDQFFQRNARFLKKNILQLSNDSFQGSSFEEVSR